MTTPATITRANMLQPPDLDHDAMMLSRFGSGVSANGRFERRIVWNLLEYLKDAGILPVSVWDGGEHVTATDSQAVMELVFNLDNCTISFGNGSEGVVLVLGNGIDIISDWTARGGVFDKAMGAFSDQVELLA